MNQSLTQTSVAALQRIHVPLPVPVSLAMYRFSLHFPVSMTYLTPGMVIEVSAMLVDKIHLRASDGVGLNIRACCAGGKDAYSGKTRTYRGVRMTPVMKCIVSITVRPVAGRRLP